LALVYGDPALFGGRAPKNFELSEGDRNNGPQDLDLSESKPSMRLSLAVETTVKRMRFRVLWTKLISSLSLTQRLILSLSAIPLVIRDILF